MDHCGWGSQSEIDGIRQMMATFGAEQIVNAKGGATSWEGATCLHWAAFWGYPKTIALLIENGADLDPKGLENDTPLRLAIQNKRYSSITILIKLGADLEKANESIDRQWEFDESMEEEKTKNAIAAGKAVGENRRD